MSDLAGAPESPTAPAEFLRQGSAGGREFFGAALTPVLLAACHDRLHDLHWFRADWQRGGALTGYATWTDEAGRDLPVVVKLPVPPQELLWLERLQPERHNQGQVTPHLFAGDRALNGYDLAWCVMQRLPHGPLDHRWHGHEMTVIADALAAFGAAADTFTADQPPRTEDWPGVIASSRRALREGELPEAQQWNAALKSLSKKLPKVLAAWEARDVHHWCHGDVHLGNAMTLQPPPHGPALLFDLALVHTGHWVEDAVYFEHLFWCSPQRLCGVDVVKHVAQRRKVRGIRGEGNWAHLANIRRALLAAAAPRQQQEAPTNPHHLHAALRVLEHVLPHL